jgi:hypothetical protein
LPSSGGKRRLRRQARIGADDFLLVNTLVLFVVLFAKPLEAGCRI